MIGKRMLAAGTVLAATIDPVARSVTTGTLYVDWGETNPEQIDDLRWNGSENLTSIGVTHCGDPLEYFGNSWAAADSIDFASLVGWGQSGTWSSPNNKSVALNSSSQSADEMEAGHRV